MHQCWEVFVPQKMKFRPLWLVSRNKHDNLYLYRNICSQATRTSRTGTWSWFWVWSGVWSPTTSSALATSRPRSSCSLGSRWTYPYTFILREYGNDGDNAGRWWRWWCGWVDLSWTRHLPPRSILIGWPWQGTSSSSPSLSSSERWDATDRARGEENIHFQPGFNTWRTFLVKKIEHSFPFGRFVFMVACYEGYEGFCAVLCSCWRNCSPWAAVDIFCTTPWIPIIHTSDHLHALVWRSLAFAMLVHRAPWRFPGYLWDVESTRRYQDKQANIISQICAMFSTPPLTFCALSPITHRQA